MIKRCSDCHRTKSIKEFYKYPNTQDKLDYYCKTCRKARVKQYRASPHGKIVRREYDRHYIPAYKSRPDVASRIKKYSKQYKEAQRQRAFDILGDKCVFCGDTHRSALTIDHINGGGHRHRIAMRGNFGTLIKELERGEGVKRKFRILCMKCNWLRRYESDEEIIARYGNKH